MKSSQHTFSQLAKQLAGCRLAQAIRSPLKFENDFGSCRAWAEFEDGSKLELAMAATDALIDFPSDGDTQLHCDAFKEVDGIALSHFEVMGLCVAETTFSFGVILKDEVPLVLCLDTTAGMRLELHIYPLHKLLKDGGQAFFGSE